MNVIEERDFSSYQFVINVLELSGVYIKKIDNIIAENMDIG